MEKSKGNNMENKQKFMKEALKEAKKAYDKLEVPVGAVIVKDGKIIARAHNLKETKYDTTKHAEILAIQKASKKLETWRLLDCEMYVTLEPCSMCAGALINSRVKKLYIGTSDEKTGAAGCRTGYRLRFGELILADRTQGALEILGYILPLGAGGNAALGVTQFLVIFPAANVANILHN